MNSVSPESEVRDYYNARHISDESASSILAAAYIVKSAQKWKRIAVATSAGLVVMTMIALTLYFKKDTAGVSPLRIVENTLVIEQPTATDNGVEAQANHETSVQKEYQLVAFRSHGDGCPHCRATSEVYEQLASALDHSDIHFEQFHLGDRDNRGVTNRRIKQLQLEPLIEGRMETAFLALISANGAVLKEFKPSMGSPRIASQVQEVLNRSSQ